MERVFVPSNLDVNFEKSNIYIYMHMNIEYEKKLILNESVFFYKTILVEALSNRSDKDSFHSRKNFPYNS